MCHNSLDFIKKGIQVKSYCQISGGFAILLHYLPLLYYVSEIVDISVSHFLRSIVAINALLLHHFLIRKNQEQGRKLKSLYQSMFFLLKTHNIQSKCVNFFHFTLLDRCVNVYHFTLMDRLFITGRILTSV